jgi:dephospho-CoA kinase
MPLIYITGPTGSGKSTICSELNAKGYETYDTDSAGMRKIINHNGTDILALDLDKLETLKNNSTYKIIFICGTSANDLERPELFSKIFLLVINEKTQLKRILNRTNNQYGKEPHEQANALKWRDVQIEKYRQASAIEIDASWPLDEIIYKILSLV